jgi:histidine triad (HIT) family protein
MRAPNIEVPETGICAFCDYLAGRRPYTVLWREDRVAVFVTREQRGIGHVLVLPSRHVPSLLDLDDDEAGDLMIAVRDAAVAVDRAMERPGISVWQNNGMDSGQKISHLHFHVAGTLPGGGTELDEVPELPLTRTAEIAAKLRAHVPPRPATGRVFT